MGNETVERKTIGNRTLLMRRPAEGEAAPTGQVAVQRNASSFRTERIEDVIEELRLKPMLDEEDAARLAKALQDEDGFVYSSNLDLLNNLIQDTWLKWTDEGLLLVQELVGGQRPNANGFHPAVDVEDDRPSVFDADDAGGRKTYEFSHEELARLRNGDYFEDENSSVRQSSYDALVRSGQMSAAEFFSYARISGGGEEEWSTPELAELNYILQDFAEKVGLARFPVPIMNNMGTESVARVVFEAIRIGMEPDVVYDSVIKYVVSLGKKFYMDSYAEGTKLLAAGRVELAIVQFKLSSMIAEKTGEYDQAVTDSLWAARALDVEVDLKYERLVRLARIDFLRRGISLYSRHFNDAPKTSSFLKTLVLNSNKALDELLISNQKTKDEGLIVQEEPFPPVELGYVMVRDVSARPFVEVSMRGSRRTQTIMRRGHGFVRVVMAFDPNGGSLPYMDDEELKKSSVSASMSMLDFGSHVDSVEEIYRDRYRKMCVTFYTAFPEQWKPIIDHHRFDLVDIAFKEAKGYADRSVNPNNDELFFAAFKKILVRLVMQEGLVPPAGSMSAARKAYLIGQSGRGGRRLGNTLGTAVRLTNPAGVNPLMFLK